jgi:hypothetical protein
MAIAPHTPNGRNRNGGRIALPPLRKSVSNMVQELKGAVTRRERCDRLPVMVLCKFKVRVWIYLVWSS